MRRMLILMLVPLGWAMPASAQNSPPDQAAQQPPACQATSGQSIRQNIRSDLARAGHGDIQMVPDSFVVRAKDPTGVSVMVAVLLPEWLRFTEGFYLMGYALLVVVLMVVCPSGLLGLAARLVRPGGRPGARPSARSTAETPVAGTDAAVQSEGAR